MSSRDFCACIAILLLTASLTACTSSDDNAEPSLRYGKPVATLAPDEGSVRGSVVVRGSTAIVLNEFDDQLTVFDVRSGAELWSVDEVSSSAVWVGGDFVVFLQDEPKIHVRDLDSGDVRNEIELNPKNASGDASGMVGASHSAIFVIQAKGERRQVLSAVDASDGKQLWTYEPSQPDNFATVQPDAAVPDTGTTGAPYSTWSMRSATKAPVLHVADTGNRSAAVALDVKSGEKQWTMEVDRDNVPEMVWDPEGVISAISRVDNASFERTIASVDTESGKRQEVDVHHSFYSAKKKRWRSPGDGDGEVQIADGMVFAQDDDHHPLVTNLMNGKTEWTAKHPGEPLIFGDGVAVYQSVSSEGNGDVYAVDIATGEQLWKTAKLTPSPDSTIADGRLLTQEKSGTQVTDLRTGKGLWAYSGATLVGRDDEHFIFSIGDGAGDEERTLTVTTQDGKAS